MASITNTTLGCSVTIRGFQPLTVQLISSWIRSKQIIALRPVESNINYDISKKNRELQSLQLEETLATTLVKERTQKLNTQIDSLTLLKEKISAQIQVLFDQKKQVAKFATNYASKGILRWDFGRSYIDNKRVSEKFQMHCIGR